MGSRAGDGIPERHSDTASVVGPFTSLRVARVLNAALTLP